MVSPADPRIWVERESDAAFADFLSRCRVPVKTHRVVVLAEGALCPPDHRHGASMTCYATHGCRCVPCKTAKRDHQRRVRAGEIQMVPALGSIRRVQALVALGWSVKQVSTHGDLGYGQVAKMLQRGTKSIRPETAAAIDAVFEQLWDQRPDAQNGGERVSVARALNYARRHGFVPPLAWDDIDFDEAPSLDGEEVGIDEIAVELAADGHDVDLTPAERRAAVRLLHARRMNDYEIAARLRCSDRTVLRIRQELDLPEVFGQIEWRPRPSDTKEAA